MKVTIKPARKYIRRPKIEYPCIMRWEGQGDRVVVLFLSKDEGIELKPTGLDAENRKAWLSPNDRKSMWEPFEGTITINCN